MEHQLAAHVLSSIEALLDGFEVATVGAGERLDCSRVARRLASRLSAVAGLLLAGAEAAQESLRGTGTPTTSWLAIQDGLSKREAARRAESDRVGRVGVGDGSGGKGSRPVTDPARAGRAFRQTEVRVARGGGVAGIRARGAP